MIILRKIGHERLFKVTGNGITNAKLVTSLTVIGNHVGFRVGVMLQNPRRPKWTKGNQRGRKSNLTGDKYSAWRPTMVAQ